MLQYKQNLEVLNGRYTGVERQMLKFYAKSLGWIDSSIPGHLSIMATLRTLGAGSTFGFCDVSIPEGMHWMISNLVEDGIVVAIKSPHPEDRDQGLRVVQLTQKGIEMVERMISPEPI